VNSYSIGGALELDGLECVGTVTIRGMSAGFQIDKLSDEFGQYTLVLKCAECGHERKAEPRTLGRLCGWDARLEDIAKRMRCSKCGKKRCTLKAFPPKKAARLHGIAEIGYFAHILTLPPGFYAAADQSRNR